jgi:hypothetical protein
MSDIFFPKQHMHEGYVDVPLLTIQYYKEGRASLHLHRLEASPGCRSSRFLGTSHHSELEFLKSLSGL